jgi:hypothetical protein
MKYYWRVLSQSFEREIRLAIKCVCLRTYSYTRNKLNNLALTSLASPYFLQIFQIGYPKLLRLFHDFFSRLAVVTGASLTHSGPANNTSFADSSSSHSNDDHDTPKATILLRALSTFETAYQRESLSRSLDPINLAFPERPVVGVRPVPTRDDVEKVLRTASRY